MFHSVDQEPTENYKSLVDQQLTSFMFVEEMSTYKIPTRHENYQIYQKSIKNISQIMKGNRKRKISRGSTKSITPCDKRPNKLDRQIINHERVMHNSTLQVTIHEYNDKRFQSNIRRSLK